MYAEKCRVFKKTKRNGKANLDWGSEKTGESRSPSSFSLMNCFLCTLIDLLLALKFLAPGSVHRNCSINVGSCYNFSPYLLPPVTHILLQRGKGQVSLEV